MGSTVEDVLGRALPGRRVVRIERIGVDRGVFSRVHRVELDAGPEPPSVVVKEPDPGPNGAAAAATGAYRREALSYRSLLPSTPVAAPACHLVEEDDDGRVTLVLEDLSHRRAVDQLDGLQPDDAFAVAEQLAAMHASWGSSRELATLAVRRSAPSALEPAALEQGRVLLEQWPQVDAPWRRTLGDLLARRPALVEAFTAAGPLTLCHGDPRADNVVFRADGTAVLFDWQQVAIQFPEADLAWLAATSLEPEVRRQIERDLVEAHASTLGHDPGPAWERYRLGMVLPGLAVLMLVQRQVEGPRARELVSTSVRRILTATTDLEVPRLAG